MEIWNWNNKLSLVSNGKLSSFLDPPWALFGNVSFHPLLWFCPIATSNSAGLLMPFHTTLVLQFKQTVATFGSEGTPILLQTHPHRWHTSTVHKAKVQIEAYPLLVLLVSAVSWLQSVWRSVAGKEWTHSDVREQSCLLEQHSAMMQNDGCCTTNLIIHRDNSMAHTEPWCYFWLDPPPKNLCKKEGPYFPSVSNYLCSRLSQIVSLILQSVHNGM